MSRLVEGEPYELKGSRTVLRAARQAEEVARALTPTGYYSPRVVNDFLHGYARVNGRVWKPYGAHFNWRPGHGKIEQSEQT